MCKTGTTPKRPAGLAAPPTPPIQVPQQSNVPSTNQFFPNFFGASTFYPFQASAMPQLPEMNKDNAMCLPSAVPSSMYLPQQLGQFPQSNMTCLNFPSSAAPWYQPSPTPVPQFSHASQLQAQMDMFGRANSLMQPQQMPSLSPVNNRLVACSVPVMDRQVTARSSQLEKTSFASQPPKKSLKRVLPDMVSDSNSEHSGCSDSERVSKPQKQEKQPKRKHEATLDGERRVAIEFENLGTVGEHPQTYGKGALLVPDGVCGKYSAFGQRWRFNISHAVGPVICEDGVQRMCLSWSITNLNSGVTHTVLETPADAMKRDRDGKTLCNRVFRDALSLRASALESELRRTEDPAACVDLQSQLRTIQTKRFSEGPLFFGLRHCSLQQELRRELSLRKSAESGNQAVPMLGAPCIPQTAMTV